MWQRHEDILLLDAKIGWQLLSEEQRQEFMTWATAGHNDLDFDALLDCSGVRGERRTLKLARYCDALQRILGGPSPRELRNV
jgi:hypothetical protein